jgi:hypothetical protein
VIDSSVVPGPGLPKSIYQFLGSRQARQVKLQIRQDITAMILSAHGRDHHKAKRFASDRT